MEKLQQLTKAIGKAHPTKQILGQDISLEDVLIAINKKDIWAIDLNGEFFSQDEYSGDPIYKNAKWQFNKSLHLQKKPTIDFLHNLICN